jgi:hypothetical protein
LRIVLAARFWADRNVIFPQATLHVQQIHRVVFPFTSWPIRLILVVIYLFCADLGFGALASIVLVQRYAAMPARVKHTSVKPTVAAVQVGIALRRPRDAAMSSGNGEIMVAEVIGPMLAHDRQFNGKLARLGVEVQDGKKRKPPKHGRTKPVDVPIFDNAKRDTNAPYAHAVHVTGDGSCGDAVCQIPAFDIDAFLSDWEDAYVHAVHATGGGSSGDAVCPSLSEKVFLNAWPLIADWIKSDRKKGNRRTLSKMCRLQMQHLLRVAFWRMRLEVSCHSQELDHGGALDPEDPYRGWDSFFDVQHYPGPKTLEEEWVLRTILQEHRDRANRIAIQRHLIRQYEDSLSDSDSSLQGMWTVGVVPRDGSCSSFTDSSEDPFYGYDDYYRDRGVEDASRIPHEYWEQWRRDNISAETIAQAMGAANTVIHTLPRQLPVSDHSPRAETHGRAFSSDEDGDGPCDSILFGRPRVLHNDFVQCGQCW